MNNFGNSPRSNGLVDLGFQGYSFTWFRGTSVSGCIEERVDCFCASKSWCQLFLGPRVWHLPFYGSDHSPILLDSSENLLPSYRRIFKRFESWWLEEQDIYSKVVLFWNQNMARRGIRDSTLSQLVCFLHNWAKSVRPNFHQQIVQVKKDLVRALDQENLEDHN